MTKMKALFTRFVREESGQDLIEYLLLATLIAIVVVGGAGALGTNLDTWYNSMATWVSGANTAVGTFGGGGGS
jgi:pilus assembly protein Flp/PilA